MVHCPDCGHTLSTPEDVEFVERDAETNLFAASKRYYSISCANCGEVLGGGVAGAKAGGGGGAV